MAFGHHDFIIKISSRIKTKESDERWARRANLEELEGSPHTRVDFHSKSTVKVRSTAQVSWPVSKIDEVHLILVQKEAGRPDLLLSIESNLRPISCNYWSNQNIKGGGQSTDWSILLLYLTSLITPSWINLQDSSHSTIMPIPTINHNKNIRRAEFTCLQHIGQITLWIQKTPSMVHAPYHPWILNFLMVHFSYISNYKCTSRLAWYTLDITSVYFRLAWCTFPWIIV